MEIIQGVLTTLSVFGVLWHTAITEGDDAYLVTVLDHPDQKPLNYSLAIFKLSSDFLSIESKVFEGFENGGREVPHIIKVGDYSGSVHFFL